MNINYFMQEAIYEGRKALPGCLPNPPVGCVLVKDNQIIARGHTQPPGKPHAEAMALSQIDNDKLNDVIAFVTLEPCSFYGRTPSCAKALVARQVKMVYVAMLDPDPRNSGAGIKLLQDAEIEVQVGLLKDIAEQDLRKYLAKS